MKKFKVLPFKDTVYVIFTPEDLKTIHDLYANDPDYGASLTNLDKVDNNHSYTLMTAPGHANAHIVYLPICTRQGAATPWNPMNPVIARYATEIVLNCCKAAGYNPTNEHTMFVQQVARIQQRITEIIADRFHARLVMSSWMASYLDTHLTPQQWVYVDALMPSTLADLARQQCMIEDAGVVDLSDDGGWRATTYFY